MDGVQRDRHRRRPAVSDPVVRLRNAGLSYGSRTLWDGLDLDIHAGEFLAVLGPNGSGKTSFLKILLGLQQLSRGTVEINGRPAQRGSRDIGYIPQQKAFGPGTPLRARDLVGLGVDGNKWGLRLNRSPVRRRVDELLDQVGATRYANEPVGLLSGGELQRVLLALALEPLPNILILDEPLSGVDVEGQTGLMDMLDEIRKTYDLSILMTTHDFSMLSRYADRVVLIDHEVKCQGTPQEVLASPEFFTAFHMKEGA